MEKETNCYRVQDTEIEKEISAFLDEHFYGRDFVFTRIDERGLQINGIDGFLTCDKLGLKDEPCDEKCGIHYVNRYLTTYLMELSQKNKNGEVMPGWFLNHSCQTRYYILMYIHADVPKKESGNEYHWEMVNRNNITKIEYYIVSRKKIQDYLDSIGFPEYALNQWVDYMRNYSKENKYDDNGHYWKEYKLKFVYTPFLKEEPVNVCIKQEVYRQICEYHGVVTNKDNGITI